MPRTLTREWYIRPGSYKVSDKQSDAVAYIYTSAKGRLGATVFFGKQSKPVADYVYRTAEERAKRVGEMFAGRKASIEAAKQRREAGPSSRTVRNAMLKKALEAKYGRGRVSVTGGKGTAYGWTEVRFKFAQPKGITWGNTQHEIVALAKAAGVKIGTYDSGDYGAGYQLSLSWGVD